MTTTDDIFWLYERNKRAYCYCNNKSDYIPGSNVCNNYCFENIPVSSLTIGDTDIPCNINRKCYIKQGEECSICLENVMTKNTAYLSPCGHTFHKKCIFQAYESKMYSKWASVFRCPMCRQRINIPELSERYNLYNNNNNNIHILDELESFWLHKDTRIPEICNNGYNHYMGLKKTCLQCIDYRNCGNTDEEI